MNGGCGILLVTGGEAEMTTTFREHGRGYWSAEFALILEKHGWLDFEQAEPEALESVERLTRYAAVIVAWLPEAKWREAYIRSLSEYDGVLLLEGPFPPEVEQLLDVERRGEPLLGAGGALRFSDRARTYIDRRFGTTFRIGHRSGPDPGLELGASGEPNPLQLSPREAVTRRPGLSRDAYAQLAVHPLELNVGKAAVSLTLAYRARFAQNERFFDDPVEDALALLACVRCLAALSAGTALHRAFERLVIDAAGSNRAVVALSDDRAAVARAIWGVALAEAAAALGDTTFAERAKEIVVDARRDWGTPRFQDPVLRRWRALLAVTLSRQAGAAIGPSAARVLDAFLGGEPEPRGPLEAWLDVALARFLPPGVPDLDRAGSEWIASIARELQGSGGAQMPSGLEGLGVPELMLVLGTLRQLTYMPAARRLWRLLLETLHDARQGLFLAGRVTSGRLAPGIAFAVSPMVALGLLDAAGAIDIVDGPTEALARYTAEQIEAWRAAPYTLQPYGRVGGEIVASLVAGDRELPAIWRRGNVIATSFQLLAHLVHVHTVEPLAEPFGSFRSGDATVLEYLLLHLLGAAIAEHEPAIATVAPWPWGVRYGLTVRHDVDRVLDEPEFRRLTDFERSRGLAVSWFWLPDRLDRAQLEELGDGANDEIALHAVRIAEKRRELELVGQAVVSPILGEAIHGSGDAWVGHSSVRAAVEAGLLYTELSPPIADRPYARYPVLSAEGLVDSEKIIGVTYNVSIEGKLGAQPGSEGGPGVYRQLLNHPDLNFDRLKRWIDALPADKRVDWTCEQVARWWQATHVAGNLSISGARDAERRGLRLVLTSRHRVEDLELRVPCRPDDVVGVSIDGSEAEWLRLVEPEHTGIRVRLTLDPDTPRSVVVASIATRSYATSLTAAR